MRHRILVAALTVVTLGVLTACSPACLYQLVQPMSDVPAAALWLWALLAVRRGSTGDVVSGLCIGIAILVYVVYSLLLDAARPNGLIVGPAPVAGSFLHDLTPMLRKAVVEWPIETSPSRAHGHVPIGTLIIRDVVIADLTTRSDSAAIVCAITSLARSIVMPL